VDGDDDCCSALEIPWLYTNDTGLGDRKVDDSAARSVVEGELVEEVLREEGLSAVLIDNPPP
tara:strand:+ start:564 stop:749 length:186 start_codon:yes stop_codon:yes gene_type:complete